MKTIKHSVAVSLATALTALSVTPAAFAFGGFHGADIPEEARTEMKECHESVLAKYGIEVPAKVEGETTGRRYGRRHFWGATSNLTEEQRTAMKEEKKACKTSVAEKYNLELPDRSEYKGRRGFGHRGYRGHRGGGFFGAGMQDLSEEDRSTLESLMQQIRDLMQKYQPSN